MPPDTAPRAPGGSPRPRPSGPIQPTGRRLRAGTFVLAAWVALALGLVSATGVGATPAEQAQASSSTSSSTPIGASAITKEGSKTNSVGLVVGGVTVAIIAGGAAILYLTHRRKA